MSQALVPLLLAAKRGDPGAWEALLREVRRPAIACVRAFDRSASPEEQEDRVQACMVWMIKNRASILGGYEEGRGGVLTWLTYFWNQALLNHKRSQRALRYRMVEASGDEALADQALDAPESRWVMPSGLDCEHRAILAENLQAIAAVVETRDEVDRQTFWAHLVMGMEQADVARALGVKTDVIAQRRHRLVQALKKTFPDLVLATWLAVLVGGFLSHLGP